MFQFLSINSFLGFLQFLLGFSKVPVFCVTLYIKGTREHNQQGAYNHVSV